MSKSVALADGGGRRRAGGIRRRFQNGSEETEYEVPSRGPRVLRNDMVMRHHSRQISRHVTGGHISARLPYQSIHFSWTFSILSHSKRLKKMTCLT